MNAYMKQSVCLLLVLLNSSSLISMTLGLNVGDIAAPGQFPYVVSVAGQNKSCAGAIINENWVSTTALCVYDQSPGNVTVLAGTNRKDNTSGTVFNVSKIVVHEKFTDHTFLLDDIAMVKIDGAFKFNSLTKPVNSIMEPPHSLYLVTVTSWGSFGFDDLYYTRLLMVDYNTTCTQLLGEANVNYPRGPGQFCTASSLNCASLNDMSGPLFTGDDIGNLVGFISYSVSSCQNGSGLVNVNTNAYYYKRWINNTSHL